MVFLLQLICPVLKDKETLRFNAYLRKEGNSAFFSKRSSVDMVLVGDCCWFTTTPVYGLSERSSETDYVKGDALLRHKL